MNQVQSLCRKIKLKQSDSLVLNMVCASLVNLWLTMANLNSNSIDSLSVNGYTIKKNQNKQVILAKKLFDEWRSKAAHLLIDEGFAFFTPMEQLKR